MNNVIKILTVALLFSAVTLQAQEFQGIATFQSKTKFEVSLDSSSMNSPMQKQIEEMLKKQGVMLGQHIPSLPAKLDVSQEVLGTYGNFKEGLIVARELVEQNRENFLRRTGNLPISLLAEQKKAERGRHQESMKT